MWLFEMLLRIKDFTGVPQSHGNKARLNSIPNLKSPRNNNINKNEYYSNPN